MSKAIITCAVTGAIHTPSMSPFLPVTAAEIVAEGVAAAEAGAAMLHLHARDPRDGRPSYHAADFESFLKQLHERTDAILNITTGGGLGMTLDERLAAAMWARPEVASMNMGSLNFNISGAIGRVGTFKFDWEKPYLETTTDFILSNTFDQIERGMRELGHHGTRFEFECYDLSHFYNLAYFADRGLVKPPFFVQAVFGITGGMGTDHENLGYARATAERLFGSDYVFSVLAAGRHQMPFAALNAIMGGSVRVGLEDSLYIERGKLAKSNADQVGKITRILVELGIPIATAQEARQIIGTKGKAEVGFC